MSAENGVRLDVRLVRDGLAGGRDKAKELILAGEVSVNGRTVTKPAASVSDDDTVECRRQARYVGRGGEKLEKAIAETGWSPAGCFAMDIGASTGGFTDCLLQHGAAHVYAVDVGHDQLHPRLRADDRVTVLENTDIRGEALRRTVPPASIQWATADVSFVSLGSILPSVIPYLQEDAAVVCLIKPQFEAGRQWIGKRGIVRDHRAHQLVLERSLTTFRGLGLSVHYLDYSPITGGDGNIEYLAVMRFCRTVSGLTEVPTGLVERTFGMLK